MAKRLTEKQKAKIIADAAVLGSNRRVAEKYHISEGTVRNVLRKNPDYTQMCAEKKEECEQSMVDYLASVSGKAKDIIRQSLDALADPKRMETASYRDIATVTGILIDKFTGLDRQQKETTAPIPINITFADHGAKHDDDKH